MDTEQTNTQQDIFTPTSVELEFHYEKSKCFRVMHVDGAHGGISPDGMSIAMSVFSERRPIPTKEVFAVKNGELVQPAKTIEVRTGVFREVEAVLIMDQATVRAMRDWLNEKIQIQDGLIVKMMQLSEAASKAEKKS